LTQHSSAASNHVGRQVGLKRASSPVRAGGPTTARWRCRSSAPRGTGRGGRFPAPIRPTALSANGPAARAARRPFSLAARRRPTANAAHLTAEQSTLLAARPDSQGRGHPQPPHACLSSQSEAEAGTWDGTAILNPPSFGRRRAWPQALSPPKPAEHPKVRAAELRGYPSQSLTVQPSTAHLHRSQSQASP
jgi:hypothetical protein